MKLIEIKMRFVCSDRQAELITTNMLVDLAEDIENDTGMIHVDSNLVVKGKADEKEYN